MIRKSFYDSLRWALGAISCRNCGLKLKIVEVASSLEPSLPLIWWENRSKNLKIFWNRELFGDRDILKGPGSRDFKDIFTFLNFFYILHAFCLLGFENMKLDLLPVENTLRTFKTSTVGRYRNWQFLVRQICIPDNHFVWKQAITALCYYFRMRATPDLKNFQSRKRCLHGAVSFPKWLQFFIFFFFHF